MGKEGGSVRLRSGFLVSCLQRRRIYLVVLVISRLILSVCQSAVSLDTWGTYSKLSKAPSEMSREMSLETVADFSGDLSWVPVSGRVEGKPEFYGMNRLFNLYLIRLSHYFHSRISSFLVFFSSVIFFLLVAISCFDVYVISKRRFARDRFPSPVLLLRFSLYSLLFGLVFTQFIFLLYYRSSLCSMESLYPFLFGSGDGDRLEFLRSGTCGFSQRFLFTYILSFLTLVPDSFLILVSILPSFRVHSLLNGMKYFGSIFLFITAFIALDTRRYISIGQDPKILDYGTKSHAQMRPADPNLKYLYAYKSMKMVDMTQAVSHRVSMTMNYSNSKQGGESVDKVKMGESEDKFKMDEKEFEEVSRLNHFNFAKQLYGETRFSSLYYFYFGLYSGSISVIDAVSGTILIVKRHRFLIWIVAIVNFFYFFTNIVHCIMLQFPLRQTQIFCSVTDYASDLAGLAFETLAISDLACKIRRVYVSSFVILILLVVLGFCNVVNLYFIHKSH